MGLRRYWRGSCTRTTTQKVTRTSDGLAYSLAGKASLNFSQPHRRYCGGDSVTRLEPPLVQPELGRHGVTMLVSPCGSPATHAIAALEGLVPDQGSGGPDTTPF